MRPRGSWLIALAAVAGACSGGTASTTAASTPPTTTTLAVTTLGTTTSTTAAPTTTLALPDEPLVSAGWTLQAGDVLVSNGQGVAVVRDGVIVSQPVTSPVESAFAEGSGAILFVTPDPDLFPRYWPERSRGGGYFVWRVLPDRTLTRALRSGRDFTLDGPLGPITLFQVPAMDHVIEGYTTPIFTIASPDAYGERVHLAPAGNFSGIGGGIARRLGEGAITGVGWQETNHRLIVSIASDGGGWLESWDLDDPIPVDWPSEWPTNPVPAGTRCPDDASFDHCLDSVTTLPGTTLIAYTETDSLQSFTNLILYDTATGTELLHILVAERPAVVKQLHASDTQVAVSLMTYRDRHYEYLPTMIVDVDSGQTRTLPIGGVSTITP